MLIPWSKLLKTLDLSEVRAAERAGISRLTWRKLTHGHGNVELQSLLRAVHALGRDLEVLAVPQESNGEVSTVSVGYQVLRDGEDSWKIHYMNFVDEFRRTLDPRLILLPPPRELSKKMTALLASIVFALCEEAGMSIPTWARKRFDLPKPWFVSGMQSLKASALLESPMAFRRNGIFVNANFLERA